MNKAGYLENIAFLSGSRLDKGSGLLQKSDFAQQCSV